MVCYPSSRQLKKQKVFPVRCYAGQEKLFFIVGSTDSPQCCLYSPRFYLTESLKSCIQCTGGLMEGINPASVSTTVGIAFKMDMIVTI